MAINNLSFVIYIRTSDKRTYNYLKAKLYSVDLDEVAHDELSHLDLCCLQTSYLHTCIFGAFSVYYNEKLQHMFH